MKEGNIMDSLIINNISKTYYQKNKTVEVIKNLSLNVKEGEIVAIIGPSGGGKSTILNLISGIIKPDNGTISINGKIGYMFQHDLLFEWRNILDNLLIGLEISKKINQEDVQKALKMLEKYELLEFKNAHPSELSGGMRQRIALIRTLMMNPSILLLDEPFSALDAQTRIKICNDVYQMIKEEKLTVILVTHDINEAISIADRIIVLSKRPATIIKEYNVLFNESTPLKRRSNPHFNCYFEAIWGDLSE